MFIPSRQPLLEATFLARYDRFIASVKLNGRTVDAHCVNTGRMEGLIQPGARAWVSEAPAGSKRKLRYTLELLEIDGICIGVNTQVPNHLAEEAVRAGWVPGLKRFSDLRREVRYGENSRIDLLLRQGQIDHYVEVKNCHLVYADGGAYFPDSVSVRAAGHLRELAHCIRNGDKATVLFTVQRNDARQVLPSDLHDPEFAVEARRAFESGVRFIALGFEPTPEGFHFLGPVPVSLKEYDIEPLEPYREALEEFSGWKRRGKTKTT